MATAPVFAPDGTLGDVPQERLQDAIKAGGKPGVEMLAPDGTKGVVPAERFQDAVKAGGRPVPISNPEPERPGVLSTLGSAMGRIGKAIITPQAQNPYPGMGVEQKQEATQESAEADQERKKAGYSPAYRIAAPIAQSIGTNVPKMEQDAREGNEDAVYGEAAAPLVTMAAAKAIPTETAGKVAKTGVELAKGAGRLGDVATFERISKGASSIGKTVGKIGDIWKKPESAPVPLEVPAAPSSAPEPAIPTAPESMPKVEARAKLEKLLGDATGAKPAQPIRPGIPMRDQFKAPQAAIPEGHTPVESTAVTSFKYDPAAKELHVAAKGGTTYVFGEVSPEQAETFSGAESKGKAWKDIRDSSPLVAKVTGGKRIAVKPTGPGTTGNAIPTPPVDDLTPLLERSLAKKKAAQ